MDAITIFSKPDEVAALRALVLVARAERDTERAEKARLIEERDQLAGQNDRLRHLVCSSAGVRRSSIPTSST